MGMGRRFLVDCRCAIAGKVAILHHIKQLMCVKPPSFQCIRVILTCTALLLTICSVNAESLYRVELSSLERHFDLGDKVFVLEDIEENNVDQLIMSWQGLGWWQSQQEIISLGFREYPHWFVFKLYNDTGKESEIYLEVGYPLLDEIELYLVNASGHHVMTDYKIQGDMFTYGQRELKYPGFVFPLTIPPKGEYFVFLRVKTTSAMQVPLRIWRPNPFHENAQSNLLLIGLLVGILIVMAVYNLFLYAAIKDRSYLYFFLTLASYIFVQNVVTGLNYQYIWSDNVWWNDKSLTVLTSFSFAFLIKFTQHFLKTAGINSIADKVLTCTTIGFFICAVASILFPYKQMIKIMAVFVTIVPVSLFLFAAFLWWRGYELARFFVLAFTVFIFGSAVFALSKFGWVQRNLLTENLLYIASSCVAVLFSFALGDRINKERRQKEIAQQESIHNLKKFQNLYENAIEGIFRISVGGRVLAVNPAFVRLLGFSSMEKMSEEPRNIWDFIPEGPIKKEIGASLEGGKKLMDFEIRGKKINGEEFWGSVNARRIYDKLDKRYVVEGTINDITRRKESEARLHYLVRHDPLTGLINRPEFEKRMEAALQQAREKNTRYALFYMDLDQFKIVNDTCGHDAGDELLRQATTIFKRSLSKLDTVARLGGDEFAVLLVNANLKKAEETADNLRKAMQEHKFTRGSKIFSLSVSIGIVAISPESESVHRLLSLADTACYAAKDGGRNRVYVHDESSGELRRRQNEMQLVSSIKDAIKNNKLCLHTQKIIPIGQKEISGKGNKEFYEILVRMKSEGEDIYPGAFIPTAERYDIMRELDRWVTRNCFSWLAENPEVLHNTYMVNVNLSGQSLGDPEFLSYFERLFKEYSIPGDKICVEITESVAVSNMNNTLQFIEHLKTLGVFFALDDFGSGFASFNYLKQFPVDFIKIDGTFIQDILDSEVSYAMVKSMTEVAHAMDLLVIAEFVEEEAVLEKLYEMGVNYVQGYLLNRPSLAV